MKILLADDDKLCRMLLKRLLANVPGTEITETEDGVAAWAVIERGFLPDLCIFDVMMPGLSGLDLLEKIRWHPRTQHLRVALCTTLNDRSHVSRAARLRVDAYILKPFSAEVIIREVRKAAEEMEAETDCENPDAVCVRLGIERAAYGEWITELIEHVSMLDGSVGSMMHRKSYRAAAIQVNASKGACSNLGMRKLAATLGRLEAALADAAVNPDAVDELALSSSRTALRDTILAERKRLFGRRPDEEPAARPEEVAA
jgi:CheY-like chemotaxis protein